MAPIPRLTTSFIIYVYISRFTVHCHSRFTVHCQSSLIAYHERMEAVVLEKAAKMEEIGGEAYLKEMHE